MASKCIYGKPGAGKSYYSVSLLLDLLSTDNRIIVTNIPLNFPAILVYLQQAGLPPVDLYSRIRTIEDDNLVTEFWRVRAIDPDKDHRVVSKSEVASGVRADPAHYSGGGVVYFIDEVHRFLNSREWARTGKLMLDYVSQHRHYGDDIFWITQSPANVDAQFRSVTSAYFEVRNFAHEKFFGISRGNYMEVNEYLFLSDSATPQSCQKIRLEQAKADCYSTSIIGGNADIGRTRKAWFTTKGLLWAFAALLVLIALGFAKLPAFFRWFFPEKNNITIERVNSVPVSTPSPVHSAANSMMSSVHSSTVAPTVSVTPPTPIYTLAVPLRYSSADRVMSRILSRSAESAATSPVANVPSFVPGVDGMSIIVTNGDKQALAFLGDLVRKLDIETAIVNVQAIIFRTEKASANTNDFLSFFKGLVSDSSLFESVISSLVNYSAGVATFGSSQAADLFLRVITASVSSSSYYSVVSTPTVSVMAGEEARLSGGRQVPVPVVTTTSVASERSSIDYKDVSFEIRVKPFLLPSGKVQVKLSQSNSEVVDSAKIGGDMVPVISVQSVDSLVTLGPDQLFLLGGISVDSRKDSAARVGLLERVPLLGTLFSDRSHGDQTSSVYVLLRVSVYREDEIPVRVERATRVDR